MELNRKIALKIARLTSQGKYQEIIDILSLYPSTKKGSWGHLSKKFIPFLRDRTVSPPFTVFAKGNSKLPFWSFSNLPLVNCPGKGDCAKWCYSLKAWRYPAAFFRQIQNTILVNEQSPHLINAWNDIPANSDVRLYVDGDFNSMRTLTYWFGLMVKRSDLKVYGYSKSWEILLDYHNSGKTFPENYVMNMSSGSKYENVGPIRAAIKKLPIVRGEFIAVPAGKHPSAKTVREVAKSFGMTRLFICPGKCGSCLPKQGKNVHACGSKLLTNTNIIIGTH